MKEHLSGRARLAAHHLGQIRWCVMAVIEAAREEARAAAGHLTDAARALRARPAPPPPVEPPRHYVEQLYWLKSSLHAPDYAELVKLLRADPADLRALLDQVEGPTKAVSGAALAAETAGPGYEGGA